MTGYIKDVFWVFQDCEPLLSDEGKASHAIKEVIKDMFTSVGVNVVNTVEFLDAR